MTYYSPLIWGSFIRNVRKSRGWTLQKMAEMCQCHYQYILDQEKGRLPDIGWVVKTAKLLGEDPEEWLRVYLEAKVDAVNYDPARIFSEKKHPLRDIPPELRAVLSTILRNGKLYQKALNMLKLLVE